MIVEVVAVGTELLIGQIVNSNAALIGRRLAEEGFDAHYQVTVGDNLSRIVATLDQALARSDAVVITGGIGPTQDDLTREALCRVAGREMTRDDGHADWILERLRGRRPAENVLRMADLPEGAEGLPNVSGVALGVALEHHGKWLFAVPGVPAEMIAMLDGEVLPRLRRISGGPAVLKSRVLRTWGLGESQIAEILDDLFSSVNPSVAFLISDMEVKVRVTAKADGEASAERLIEPMVEEVRRRLGAAVFAQDEETVEGIVVGLLAARGSTAATVEEATLGQVGARLAAAGGDLYRGSLVVGSGRGEAPHADVVLTVGPIGPDAPTGSRTTRPVEMRVLTPEGESSRVFDFGGDDERVRSFAAIAALHLLRLSLSGSEPAS